MRFLLVLGPLLGSVAADSPFNHYISPLSKSLRHRRGSASATAPQSCTGAWQACANQKETRACTGAVAQERPCVGSNGHDDYCQKAGGCLDYEGACSSTAQCAGDRICWPTPSRGSGSTDLYAERDFTALFPTVNWADGVRKDMRQALCVPPALQLRAAYQEALTMLTACTDRTPPPDMCTAPATRVVLPANASSKSCPLFTSPELTSAYALANLNNDINTQLSGAGTPLPDVKLLDRMWAADRCTEDVISLPTEAADPAQRDPDKGECSIAKEQAFKLDLSSEVNSKLQAAGRPERVPVGTVVVEGQLSMVATHAVTLSLRPVAKATVQLSGVQATAEGFMRIRLNPTNEDGTLETAEIAGPLDEVAARIPGVYNLSTPIVLTKRILVADAKNQPTVVPVAVVVKMEQQLQIDAFKVQSVPKVLAAQGATFDTRVPFRHNLKLLTPLEVSSNFQSPASVEVGAAPLVQWELTEPKSEAEAAEADQVLVKLKGGKTHLNSNVQTISSNYELRFTIGASLEFNVNGLGTVTTAPIGAQRYLTGSVTDTSNPTECWTGDLLYGTGVATKFGATLRTAATWREQADQLAAELCPATSTCCRDALAPLIVGAEALGVPTGVRNDAAADSVGPELPTFTTIATLYPELVLKPKGEPQQPAQQNANLNQGEPVTVTWERCVQAGPKCFPDPSDTSVPYVWKEGETDAEWCHKNGIKEDPGNCTITNDTERDWVKQVHNLKCPPIMRIITQWVPDLSHSGSGAFCYVCGRYKEPQSNASTGQTAGRRAHAEQTQSPSAAPSTKPGAGWITVGSCPGQNKIDGVQRCCYDEASVLITPTIDVDNYYEIINIAPDVDQTTLKARLQKFVNANVRKPDFQRARWTLDDPGRRAQYDAFLNRHLARAELAGSPWRGPFPVVHKASPEERRMRCICGPAVWRQARPPFQPVGGKPKSKALPEPRGAERRGHVMAANAPATQIEGAPSATIGQMRAAQDGAMVHACLHPDLAKLMAGAAPAPVVDEDGTAAILTDEELAAAAMEKQRQKQIAQNTNNAKLPLEGVDAMQCGPLRNRLTLLTRADRLETADRLQYWNMSDEDVAGRGNPGHQLTWLREESKRMTRSMRSRMERFITKVKVACRNSPLNITVLKGWSTEDIHTDGSLYYGGRALELRMMLRNQGGSNPASSGAGRSAHAQAASAAKPNRYDSACAQAIRREAGRTFPFARLPGLIMQKCSRRGCYDVTAFGRVSEEKQGWYRSLNKAGIFDQVVGGSSAAFVMFYAPWDQKAIDLYPAWYRLSDHVYSDPKIRARVQISRVDVIRYPDLIKRFSLNGPFGVLWFNSKSTTPVPYPENQAMDDASLFTFVNKQLSLREPLPGAKVKTPWLDVLKDPPIPKYPEQTFPFRIFVCTRHGPRGAATDQNMVETPCPKAPQQQTEAAQSGSALRRGHVLRMANYSAQPPLPGQVMLADIGQPVALRRLPDGMAAIPMFVSAVASVKIHAGSVSQQELESQAFSTGVNIVFSGDTFKERQTIRAQREFDRARAPWPGTSPLDPFTFFENGEVRQAVFIPGSVPEEEEKTQQQRRKAPAKWRRLKLLEVTTPPGPVELCQRYNGRVVHPLPGYFPVWRVMDPDGASSIPQGEGIVCVFNCGENGCSAHAEALEEQRAALQAKKEQAELLQEQQKRKQEAMQRHAQVLQAEAARLEQRRRAEAEEAEAFRKKEEAEVIFADDDEEEAHVAGGEDGNESWGQVVDAAGAGDAKAPPYTEPGFRSGEL
eukprot:TRINITY_DN65948_c0_g1_i1.p1 TRINITY_DN65948_c0_g1~~TRINITY_DN65948_c0_g1_i1.p1  ORF type:complete len:1763 (+),score=473.11 TRINITY_DN65948_c0_g1_i1:96-5384(+)